MELENKLAYNRYQQLDKIIATIYGAKKEGANMNRRSKKSKDWSKVVLERDNYKCRMCEIKNNLVAHHIIPWKISVKHRFCINNGLTLCNSCHAKIEGFKKGHKHHPETINKISNSLLGKTSWNKGKKLTEEHVKNLKKSHIGQKAWNKGIYTEPEKRRKCRICKEEKEIEGFTPQGKYRTRMCKSCRNRNLRKRRNNGNQ